MFDVESMSILCSYICLNTTTGVNLNYQDLHLYKWLYCDIQEKHLYV